MDFAPTLHVLMIRVPCYYREESPALWEASHHLHHLLLKIIKIKINFLKNNYKNLGRNLIYFS